MASRKPNISITLPRDFKFSYADGSEPQTPSAASDFERPSTADAPPPPKQTFKLRRRRLDQSDSVAMDEMPILPTVEMTEAPDQPPFNVSQETTPGYLAPRARHLRLLSPPKTPASQVTSYNLDNSDATEWSMFHSAFPHDVIQRPLSAMSNFSDSSSTSFGSSNDSHPSFEAGSCTSPESDFADPFAFHEYKSAAPGAITPSSSFPTAKRVKTMRHPKWTPEMDEHLWITYMMYCQDPRVTPFKMLPGTSPPLGVCHRVAREAKLTWRGHRLSHGPPAIPRISIQRADSPDTVCPSENHDDTTPTAAYSRKSIPLKWPRSEGATRRRLRELCKRKPSLSAHYLRLLRTRSPSPFESSSSSSSSPAQPSAFESRSLNVSLAQATAPSMQPNGPLADLQRTPQPPPAPQQRRPSDWFARIGRSGTRASGTRAAHQKSQSLQLNLGLGSASGLRSNTFERGSILASPFDDDSQPRNNNFLQSMNKTQSLGRAFFNNRKAENNPTLDSPLQLDGPMPSVRSLKRRFGVGDESAPLQPSLEDVFTAPPASNHRSTRNRGFSLSAMGGMGQNNFSPMFSPASSTVDHKMGEASNNLQPPKLAQAPRLGSPFSVNSSNARFNTFPRRFTPREAGLVEQPFEDRIRRLSASSQPGL